MAELPAVGARAPIEAIPLKDVRGWITAGLEGRIARRPLAFFSLKTADEQDGRR